MLLGSQLHERRFAFFVRSQAYRDRQIAPTAQPLPSLDRIHAHRVARVPGPGTKEKRLRLDIVTVGHDIATVTLVYKVRGKDMTGRQTQTWVRFPDVGWTVIAAHVSMIAETPVL